MTTSFQSNGVETTLEDWFLYYVALFNKTHIPVYAQLALWYLLLALGEGEVWARKIGRNDRPA